MEENTVNSVICSAINENNLTTLQLLLNQGHSIDFKDEKGNTPLHLAINLSSQGCVQILLKHPNSPINVKNNEGCTCLYLACKNRLVDNIIKDLLDNGADPNIADYDQKTPTHIACQNGNLNVVKLLYEHGADMNAQNKYKITPIHCSIQAGAKDLVKYLLENNVDMSLKGKLGYNALMWAIYSEEEEIIDMILPLTVDLNEAGKTNDTAFDLAIQFSNLKVLEVLIDKAPDSILKKIEILLTSTLRVESHLPQLTIILRAPNLSLVLKDVPGIFKNLFAFTFYPQKMFFEVFKNNFEFLVHSLIHHKVKVDNVDLTTFMNFLKCCPYRLELLKVAVENLDFKIKMDDIVVAFLINPEFGMYFLQNSVPHLDCCIYDHLLVAKVDVYKLNCFLPLFTPKCLSTYKNMYVRNKYEIEEFQRCVSVKMQSLKELSRDVARYYIGGTYSNVGNENKKITDFQNIVRRLNVPTVIKDILLLKKPVTDLF